MDMVILALSEATQTGVAGTQFDTRWHGNIVKHGKSGLGSEAQRQAAISDRDGGRG
jgi:hypothetical protein